MAKGVMRPKAAAKGQKAVKTAKASKPSKPAKTSKPVKAAKTAKVRPWTKDDIRSLKTLAREKEKTSDIARKLKRTIGATYQKAMRLGVTLKGNRATRT